MAQSRKWLSDPYSSESLEVWRQRLSSAGSVEARSEAFLAVMQLSPREDACECALQHLADPEPELRAASANWFALGLRRKQPDFNPDVTHRLDSGCQSLLTDDDPDVRLAAARVLGMLNPAAPRLAATILELIARTDVEAVSQVVLARLCGEVPATSPSALPHLARLLAAEQSDVREAAAQSLASWGSGVAGAVTELTAALDDEEPLVRESAAIALGQIHAVPETTRAALEQATHDEDREVAAAATNALRKFSSPET